MMAAGMVGTVGKFMSATHMGMASNPSLGASGAKPLPAPSASSAMASLPRRSRMEVKSYCMEKLLCLMRKIPRMVCCHCSKAPEKGQCSRKNALPGSVPGSRRQKAPALPGEPAGVSASATEICDDFETFLFTVTLRAWYSKQEGPCMAAAAAGERKPRSKRSTS